MGPISKKERNLERERERETMEKDGSFMFLQASQDNVKKGMLIWNQFT